MNTVIHTSRTSAHVFLDGGDIRCRYQFSDGTEMLCIRFNMDEQHVNGWEIQLSQDMGRLFHVESSVRHLITTFDNQIELTTGDLLVSFGSFSIVGNLTDLAHGTDTLDYQSSPRPQSANTGMGVMVQINPTA